MRFNLKQQKKHKEIVAGVAWNRKNQLFSCGDDSTLLKWDINGEFIEKTQEFDSHITSMSYLQAVVGSQELLAVACSDGSFRLLSKGSRVEKKVQDAHSGAIICIKWSYQGTALATCGEDGQIKIWAKSGLLRSNLHQTSHMIYNVVWSPDNEAILYCSQKNLSVMPQRPGNKLLTWKAHDGLVLAADWNPANNLIASCGEDCKFRIWDAFGRQLFASTPYDYVMTSVAWSPSGELLAAGSFEMLRLCDKSGWTHSFVKPECGSIMALNWSPDGTVLACGSGNGSVLFGHLVDRHISWGNIEVNVEDEKVVSVTDVLHGVKEEPDFRDRVVNVSVGYGHLVVATTQQCFIYNVKNWSTPFNFDLKDTVVTIIVQSKHHFAMIDAQGISIYNYEGKILSQPKYSGLRVEFLSSRCVSLSRDVIALLDTSNRKHVRLFDVFSGKALNMNFEYTAQIVELQLNQVDGPNERKLSFVDSNRDMFLTLVRRPEVLKIANMVDSFQWHDQSDMLTACADSKLITWFYPNAIYVDKDLMQKSKQIKQIPQVGKLVQVLNFSGNTVSIRRIDGALGSYAVSPYPRFLYEQVQTGMGPATTDGWQRGIKLCRYVNQPTLWATLAAMSIYSRAYNPAQISLASIDQIDKVQFINYVKELPSEQSRNAAFALYCKRINQAEQILLQAKLYYRAIKMNIKLFRWDRALELAMQHKTHVDTVVAYRTRYMENLGKEEKEKKFLELRGKIDIDWDAIKLKIQKEKAREKGENVGGSQPQKKEGGKQKKQKQQEEFEDDHMDMGGDHGGNEEIEFNQDDVV